MVFPVFVTDSLMFDSCTAGDRAPDSMVDNVAVEVFETHFFEAVSVREYPIKRGSYVYLIGPNLGVFLPLSCAK